MSPPRLSTAHRERRVEVEWLDHLDPQDPRAHRSRRELACINTLMLQRRAMLQLLRQDPPLGYIVDLGGGDGTFLLGLARCLRAYGIRANVVLVDRQPTVAAATRRKFACLGWTLATERADALDYLEHGPPMHTLLANLFLHHFAAPELARLLLAASTKAQQLLACEPRRNLPCLLASRLLRLLACGDVTCHDAYASVRAGFAGRELTQAWPAFGWHLDERFVPPFTHAFAARRGGTP